MSDNVGRRGFLARILAVGTAPALVGFIDDESLGLSIPDRKIETATEMPKRDVPPLIFGASPLVIHSGLHAWSTYREIDHAHLHRGDGSLVFLWDGEFWAVPAFRVPDGHALRTPKIETTG